MNQFRRSFQLIVGDESGSLTVDALRFTFRVDQYYRPQPDASTFSIYNLSPTSRSYLMQLTQSLLDNGTPKSRKPQLRLALGYNGDQSLVFLGEVLSVASYKDGVDWITRIQANDGLTDYAKSTISKTLAPGVTDKDIIGECLSVMPNTALGDIDALSYNEPLARSSVVFGRTRRVLNTVAWNQGRDWSIGDGRLNMVGPATIPPQGDPYLLAQETGMIGTPELLTNGSVEVKCLINPRIVIGSHVVVRSAYSPEYNGEYKVLGIKTEGDTMGDEWQMTLTCANGKFQLTEKEQIVSVNSAN